MSILFLYTSWCFVCSGTRQNTGFSVFQLDSVCSILASCWRCSELCQRQYCHCHCHRYRTSIRYFSWILLLQLSDASAAVWKHWIVQYSAVQHLERVTHWVTLILLNNVSISTWKSVLIYDNTSSLYRSNLLIVQKIFRSIRMIIPIPIPIPTPTPINVLSMRPASCQSTLATNLTIFPSGGNDVALS